MDVPVNLVNLESEDIESVTRSLEEGWFSSAGPYVQEFESLWASYCDRKYAIAVSSGTTALIVAVKALNLEPGDEVIIPSFTIISCALAVVMTGAKLVLVDCEAETLNIDSAQVEEKITTRTKAIMVVHMYGHPSNMEVLNKIAEKYQLEIIEDAAEAHGAEYLSDHLQPESWKRCGSNSTISTFSFFANKNISCGEGGMVLTDDEELYQKSLELRNLGFSPDRSYSHKSFGYQFRLSSMQAALAIPQIKRIASILEKKKRIHDAYLNGLKDIAWLRPLEPKAWARPSHWVFPVLVDPERGPAAQVRGTLLASGIETRPLFTGMHAQPIYSNLKLGHSKDFPNTEYAAKYGLILPSGIATEEKHIKYICEVLAKL